MSHADVWKPNGCEIETHPQWTKFGDWCNNQAKSSQHNGERDACKSFGGTGAVKWCTATPADDHKSYSDLIRIEEEQEARIRNLDEQLTEQAKEINELKNEPKVIQQVDGVPIDVVREVCTMIRNMSVDPAIAARGAAKCECTTYGSRKGREMTCL